MVVLVEHARIDVHARMVGQQFLLLGGAFVGEGVVRRAQLCAQVGFKFFEVFVQRLINVLLLLLRFFLRQFLGVVFHFTRFFPVLFRVERNEPLVGSAPILIV